MKNEKGQELMTQNEQYQDYPDQNYDYPGYGFTPDPPRNPVENDAKLITSGYKDTKLMFRQPLFKKQECVELFMDKKTGKPLLKDGVPVVKRIVEMKVFTGKYDNVELEFPIKNFYSDSVTSTFLERPDVRAVNMIDDAVMDLFTDMVENDADHLGLMLELHGKKASIVDTNKSLAGAGAQMYKTTISKAEQNMHSYLRNDTLSEFEERKKKKGLFGLGFMGL